MLFSHIGNMAETTQQRKMSALQIIFAADVIKIISLCFSAHISPGVKNEFLTA